MRRVVAAGAVLALFVVSGASPHAAAQSVAAPFEVVTISGRGFGHGVGMAQDGIFSMGRAGTSTPQMLSTFYPGTTTKKQGGQVRVVVQSGSNEALLTFPSGGRIDAEGGGSGFPRQVAAGEQVRVAFANGRYSAGPPGSADPQPANEGGEPGRQPGEQGGSTTTSSTTSTTAPAPTIPFPTTSTTALGSGSPGPLSAQATQSEQVSTSSGPLQATPAGGTVNFSSGRKYRGVLEVKADPAGAMRVINSVDVETYLKGMGEVRDPSWPAAALRAQAIAARTYALRAMAAGGEICADQRCQVYLGAQAEYGAMNKAVADTSGQVLIHGGRLASTVYSANGGGFSASREEGFGTSGDGFPYLRPAPYTTRDPLKWTVRASIADVAARVGYPGKLRDVRISRAGPSGRALAVSLEGDAGVVEVTGRVFDARLGLKSTLFTLTTGASALPPDALGPSTPGEQALPEDAVTRPPRPPDPPPLFSLETTTTTGEQLAAAAPTKAASAGVGVATPFAAFASMVLVILGAAWHLSRKPELLG